jgi:Cell cycle protein.
MIFIALIDIKLIYKYAYPFLLLCLILLLSVEVIGSVGKGAERWIKFLVSVFTF